MNKTSHIWSKMKHLPFQENAPQIQLAETSTVSSQMNYSYCLEDVALSIYADSSVCISQ